MTDWDARDAQVHQVLGSLVDAQLAVRKSPREIVALLLTTKLSTNSISREIMLAYMLGAAIEQLAEAKNDRAKNSTRGS